jgi:hypothetical protein
MECLTQSARIYWFLTLFCWKGGIFYVFCFAQIVHEPGDYRSIGTGDFNDPGIWETWDGSSWITATEKPALGNNVFIDQGHEIRLTANEAVQHLYLFSAADPGRKLNLQTFELHVYGALRALRKESGEFFLNNVSSLLIDWIYPETGKIVFKGNSRTVVDRASWSANTINSRYTVVFDPLPGEVLTVNSAFKANAFILQSGTVIQTVNTMGAPACSTFSFNNQEIFNGLGPYGNLIIEPGATLISDCAAPLDPILRRSAAFPAELFHVKQGGNLILRGQLPMMDAVNVLLEGTVIYQGNVGPQQMIGTNLAASQRPNQYHHLHFEGPSVKILQDEIQVTGNLIHEGTGIIQDGPSSITFNGIGVQQVLGWNTEISELTLNKATGSLVINEDLQISSRFNMISGQLDFNGFDLRINSTGAVGLDYSGGTWTNLRDFHYLNLPTVLNSNNASFPFEDAFQGGVRMVQLLGGSPGGNLHIRFHEIPGSNWDPDFDDSDGTPILYQLNSYFEMFTSLSSPSLLEMRISAQNLIVDEVDDLRIVSNGQAAPGSHLDALDPDLLWSRRSVNFNELNGNTFTVGSYRVLSVLPLTWLEENAVWKDGKIKVQWSTIGEEHNKKFEIYRSFDLAKTFEKVGEVQATGNNEDISQYNFEYTESIPNSHVHFQIRQIDQDKNYTESRIFRLEGYSPSLNQEVKIWPNPYPQGPIYFKLEGLDNSKPIQLEIWNTNGFLVYHGAISESNLEPILKDLPKGLYFLKFKDGRQSYSVRWYKEV